MHDPGDELDEIKREIVESRSLTIKTNNLVNGLSADIHSISKRQQGYERSAKINGLGFCAAILAVVIFGAKLIIDARVNAERADTRDQSGKLQKLESEILSLKKREDGRIVAEQRAADYQALLARKDRQAALERWPAISRLPLSRTERAIFRSATEKFREELSQQSYQAGLVHIRARRWHEAEKSFRSSLSKKSDASHAPEARYQLARALRTLGRHQEAVTLLVRLSKSSASREVLDDSTFLLAQVQIDTEAWNDAKGTLRSFIRRFPNSSLKSKARSALAKLKLYH